MDTIEAMYNVLSEVQRRTRENFDKKYNSIKYLEKELKQEYQKNLEENTIRKYQV